MTPSLTKQERMIERVSRLSQIGPKGVQFRCGVSLADYQRSDPFASPEDLQTLQPDTAAAILRELWTEDGYDLLTDRALAMEAFAFRCVFGEGVAAWLLSETARMEKVDRSYEIHEPPEGFEVTKVLAELLAQNKNALAVFRMLEAGYIGWMNRSA